jgi:hypothetical protein
MKSDTRQMIEFIDEHMVPPVLLATSKTPSAQDMLNAALKHQQDRASTYDKPQGERSMAATVAAFNAVTGKSLAESEGWLLMALLKMVRDHATPGGHRDSCEDMVSYAALHGEARMAGK